MSKIPAHVIGLFQKIVFTVILLSVTRIIFLFAHADGFSNWTITDLLAGVWVDLITIGIYFIPLYGLILLPIPWRGYRAYKIAINTLFVFTVALMVFMNLVDVEYFSYTSKRSTSDIFSMLSGGGDLGQLIGAFIIDFWWLILIFLLFVFLILKQSRKFKKGSATFSNVTKGFWLKNSLVFIILAPALLVMGRGGLGLRPAGILVASKFSKNTGLVLNTPFTIVKSLGKNKLEEKQYFTKEEISKYYSTNKKLSATNQLPKNTNVMVIILESFGKEWLGKAHNGNGYTPFLDSLIDEGVYYKNAFANGRKSIEAVPAIFAGIPTLMDNPYITSIYGANEINSLPNVLKKKGYTSAFFHGATNGSMKFDAFANKAGFDAYYGRTEYNNEDNYDGSWGILDEYFMPWTAKQLSTLKAPFVSGLFTLSSHHPYYVPEEHKAHLKSGPFPICQAISYGDYSLKLFFNEAKKQAWYKNTLFVILADHTPAGSSMRYQQPFTPDKYSIPILFYHPNKKLLKPQVVTEVFDQVDIYPTVLDLLTDKQEVYSIGQSAYDKKENSTVYFLEGSYGYIKGDNLLIYAHDKAQGLYKFKEDSLCYSDSLSYFKQEAEQLEKELKATIQTYNKDLISNKMYIK